MFEKRNYKNDPFKLDNVTCELCPPYEAPGIIDQYENDDLVAVSGLYWENNQSNDSVYLYKLETFPLKSDDTPYLYGDAVKTLSIFFTDNKDKCFSIRISGTDPLED